MKKCNNCHQPAAQLTITDDGRGQLCENCFDAFHPKDEFVAKYDFDKGKSNSKRGTAPAVELTL